LIKDDDDDDQLMRPINSFQIWKQGTKSSQSLPSTHKTMSGWRRVHNKNFFKMEE
jgi:hypothetical protein